MNYEIKSPTEGEEYQIDTLRANLLSCPNINPNCEAMQVALAALDEAKRIIDMQATLARTISQSGAATKKETRNMTLSPSITSVSTKSTNSYLSPMQRSPQQKQYTTPYTESTSPINVNNHNQKVNETIKIEKIKINENKNKNPNENENKKTSNIFKIFRSILIDLPLVTCFLLTILTVSLSHIYDEYLSPQLAQFKYDDTNRRNDLTYYHRVCPLGQMSTTKAEDLYINDDFTTDDAAEHMMVHGMSVYNDLIQPETAQTLRKYIVERNQNLKGKEAISVIHNENRWSFGIGANDHPSVAKALNEIATNSVFRPALEKIAGDDPALIEMTAITAGYGATDQFWHPDVVSAGSSAKYARNFAPSYSLFVTLQVSENRYLFAYFYFLIMLFIKKKAFSSNYTNVCMYIYIYIYIYIYPYTSLVSCFRIPVENRIPLEKWEQLEYVQAHTCVEMKMQWTLVKTMGFK